jgi:hypothetical protein
MMRNWHGRFPVEVFRTQSYAAELCEQHNAPRFTHPFSTSAVETQHAVRGFRDI